ncbi:MAG: hypothetical protein IE932_00030 [Sphingopyxis terrae]|nr:hypothetical protein [Sphingopyxis terrae]
MPRIWPDPHEPPPDHPVLVWIVAIPLALATLYNFISAVIPRDWLPW